MTAQGDRTRARLAKRFPNYRAELQAKIAAGSKQRQVLVADGARWVKIDPAPPVATQRRRSAGRRVRRSVQGGVVLGRLLEEAEPAPGTILRVVFLGMRTSAKGYAYRLFELYALDEGKP